jgi:DNA adenine methylase
MGVIQKVQAARSISKSERTERERLEAKIERALRFHLEAAAALREIRDRRLYRDEFDTFESYCLARWHIARSHANRLCDWAEVAKNLSPLGTNVPVRESHARPLARLTANQQQVVWKLIGGAPKDTNEIEAVCRTISRTPVNGKAGPTIEAAIKPDGVIRPINRYGAKSAIASRIIELLPAHRCYVEPFFGSGAVLFAKSPSKVEIVNDVDADIVLLFRVLRNAKQAAELQRLLKLTPFARDEHEECRSTPESEDPVERARRFFVRCRQSYGGDVDGPWATTPNANRASEFASPVNQLHLVCERLRRVQIEHKDFRELIPKYDRSDTVCYLDPPYPSSVRGRKSVYDYEMSDDDHHDLLKIITRFERGRVILSGYRSDPYDQLLKRWNRYEIPVTLSAKTFTNGAKKTEKRVEMIWCNY